LTFSAIGDWTFGATISLPLSVLTAYHQLRDLGGCMTNDDDDVIEAAEAAVLAFVTRLPPLQREYMEEVIHTVLPNLSEYVSR
jgi:hypothetical protein